MEDPPHRTKVGAKTSATFKSYLKCSNPKMAHKILQAVVLVKVSGLDVHLVNRRVHSDHVAVEGDTVYGGRRHVWTVHPLPSLHVHQGQPL